ncbi:MAG TPA: hypothetical protein PKD37_08220 [Oligoflexia bacterium]|nr:hypothetical protein [Oligoflexia bacterium]HMP27949.1 hypothetical protein [Oligoflexia bacterium]
MGFLFRAQRELFFYIILIATTNNQLFALPINDYKTERRPKPKAPPPCWALEIDPDPERFCESCCLLYDGKDYSYDECYKICMLPVNSAGKQI